MNKKPNLKVFVYDSLKSGYQNHSRFCRGVARVDKAHVIGRLYDMGVGYPALELPPNSVLANGTGDYIQDVETQAKALENYSKWKKLRPLPGGWEAVHGEVLTFRYPAQQISGLDRLEGFRPDGHSLYQRVLAIAEWSAQTEPVWMYVMKDLRGARLIPSRVWK